MSEPLWNPSQDKVIQSNLFKFKQHLEATFQRSFTTYQALHEWSVQNKADFWSSVWQFTGIKSSISWDTVLSESNKMPGAKWFQGARLNFAENLLRYRGNNHAIIFRREDGLQRQLSFDDLFHQVACLSYSLREMGVQAGDRVAGYLPNCPETIIAMLATTSIGAIWSSCSPDFGKKGVLERFEQIKPKILFSVDGYFYGGKSFNTLPVVKTLIGSIVSIERTIIIPYLDDKPELDDLPRAQNYAQVLDVLVDDMRFEQLPFDHPLYILYSSGTTGKPKCIVHSAGGTLIQHLKEHMLHTDLNKTDKLFYFTTCGWMMWNWLVSALALGTTVVLYDGSPFHPGPSALWDFIEQEKITVFGTSAKYISAVEKADVVPRASHDLTALKTILSTGSALLPENFDFVYQSVKPDVQLSSISGGTDIVSCFALGNPMLPVYQGELQCLGLGMDVQIYLDNGTPVIEQEGELVCCSPFPSMPIYFWNDEAGRRYQEAYFDKFSHVWAHGDYACLKKHEGHLGLVILGRSDAVLNPGGVRIGTAEIYRQIETIPDILESIAVGQQWQGDERIILFVKLKAGLILDDALVRQIKTNIRQNTTPRHVPAKVIQVPDIPRTLSGKTVELAVRKIIHGKTVNNTEALANPECLAYFEELNELQED